MNIANFCDYQIYNKSWMKEQDCWIYFIHLVIVDKEHGHLHRTEHEGADCGPYSQPPDMCIGHIFLWLGDPQKVGQETV